jgi:hypothetical protein
MAGKAKPQNPKSEKSAAPDGFTQTSAPRGAQNWGHYEDYVGKDIKARLLGRMQKPKPGKNGQIEFYYRLKVYESTPAWLKPDKDSEAEKVELKRGDILCLDEKAALRCLAPLSSDGGIYDVVIRISAKIDLDNGTYWPAEVYHKLVGGTPRAVQAPVSAPVSSNSEEDVPF